MFLIYLSVVTAGLVFAITVGLNSS